MNNTSQNKRLFPFVWPWKGKNNEKVSLTQLLKQKPFTILYLITIWSFIGFLGFATTRAKECPTSLEMSFYCEYALWVKDLTEASPLIFIRNLFTTSLFHNGLDHILFVTVLGFLIIVQSHEAIFGWKKTALIFFSSYVTTAPFWSAFYTIGLGFYPDSSFIQFAFARNWMGGSIGMFQVYGALSTQSKRPLVMLSIPFLLEMFTMSFMNIDLHISLMHITSVLLGFLISKIFFKMDHQRQEVKL